MKKTLTKLIKDPGVLFSAANIFAFSQSNNTAALSIAVLTFALAIDQCCYNPQKRNTAVRQCLTKLAAHLPKFMIGDTDRPALRITAYGALASGLLSLSTAAILPGIAGVTFSVGNFLASSVLAQKIQANPEIAGTKKVLTNPAVYYGMGYAMLGLMAGGGIDLLTHPLQHIPALITTVLGVSATSLSSIGLALGKFTNPAAPFMAVALGSAINTLSGIVSGNFQGAINCCLAMCGEGRLGQINFQSNKNSASSSERGRTDHSFTGVFFSAISRSLVRPLEVIDRLTAT